MKSTGTNTVATLRRVANLTQAELGRAIGRSNLHISRIEREVHLPSRADAVKLAEVLGVPADAIQHREGERRG